jgi:hypothetical protein
MSSTRSYAHFFQRSRITKYLVYLSTTCNALKKVQFVLFHFGHDSSQEG